MHKILHELIDAVQKNPSDLDPKLVLADRLIELGNPRGEYIAHDVALQGGLDSDGARQTLREARAKVWTDYGFNKIPDYFLQNKLWLGSFPVKFPNKEKLDELDSAFVEEFPYYELLPQTDSYAQGVNALRRHCEAQEKSPQPTFPRGNNQTIYRPFTFRENILARVEDFYTLYDKNGTKRSDDDRLRLFNIGLDSCTAIAHKRDSPKFKIILQSPHLIDIREGFNEPSITEELTDGPLEYDSLDGIELDRNRGIYNQSLTQRQVPDQPAWNAAVEEDKPLLKEYANIVFSRRPGNLMCFQLPVRDTVTEDRLLDLFFSNLVGSSAIGDYYLNRYGHFLSL